MHEYVKKKMMANAESDQIKTIAIENASHTHTQTIRPNAGMQTGQWRTEELWEIEKNKTYHTDQIETEKVNMEFHCKFTFYESNTHAHAHNAYIG